MANYKISGWVWLILGAIVAGYSQFVMRSTNSNLIFFFYVGLASLGVGIAKIVIKIILKNPKNRKKESSESVRETNPQHQIILCPNCMAKNYNTFNYCQSCGHKLK